MTRPLEPYWTTPRALLDFRRGDIVRHRHSCNSWVVSGNYGNCVVAVNHQIISNPAEWVILRQEESEEE